MHRFTQSLVFCSDTVLCSLILSAQGVDTSRSEKLTKDFRSNWKFYGSLSPSGPSGVAR